MEKQVATNIALSGWSGAGTSTATMILALLLERRYYYLGLVFREVTRHLSAKGRDETVDAELAKLEEYIQPIIGKTVDQFCDHKLTDDQGIILETDLSAFRIGRHDRLYSIFLKTRYEVRATRFSLDERSDEVDVLRQRDQALRAAYQDLWQIDVFDEELIDRQFNWVLDNSELNLETTVRQVLGRLKDEPRFEKEAKLYTINDHEITDLCGLVGADGKKELRKRLLDRHLMVPVEEIMKEISVLFADDVAGFPEEVRGLFAS